MSDDFGERVRAWRLWRKMPIEDLATAARISWMNLEDIEAGQRFPRLMELERLLGALQVTMDELLRDEPGNETSQT